MMDTPVSQRLWLAAMEDNPSQFKGLDQPVETVDWASIEDFLSRMNYLVPGLDLGLPSEAQWEYACRAGTGGATYAVDPDGLAEIVWFKGNSNGKPQPVATKRCNAWGLYDMLGNVSERCTDDWHGNYNGAPADGSAWQDESVSVSRVIRGGAWWMLSGSVRAAVRNPFPTMIRNATVGFRCVRAQVQAEDGWR